MQEQVSQDTPVMQIPSPVVEDDNLYTPSSVEKKRALIMYFLFGIMIVISDKKANVFEYFHLKQSIWWWLCFMMCLVLSLVLLFLPIVRYFWILFMIFFAVMFVVLAKQARDGKYHSDYRGYWLAIFPSIWGRLLSLFEINLEDKNQPPMPEIPPTTV